MLRTSDGFSSLMAAALVFGGLLLMDAQPASAAEPLAGLKFDTSSGIDSRLESDLESGVSEVFDSVNRWSFVDFSTARSKMNPITRDCFTADCLQKAGKSIGAPAGVTIEVAGEAQIYDWTIDLWDLRSGKKLKSETGSCELCGRAEVLRTFKSSLKSTLVGTARPSQAPAKAQAEPDKPEPTTRAQPSDGGVPLRVSVVPADAEIYIDDQLAGEGEVTRPLRPGEHQVRFRKEGYQGLRETVIVNEETEGPVLLRVHLSRTDPEAVEVATSTGPIDRLGEQRDAFGWIGVGTGGVLLATGIYLTAIDGECSQDLPRTECPEIYATGGAGLTMGVLGTALLTSGAALLSWEALAGSSDTESQIEPSDSDEPAEADEPAEEDNKSLPSVSIGPTVGSDGAGVLLRGRF